MKKKFNKIFVLSLLILLLKIDFLYSQDKKVLPNRLTNKEACQAFYSRVAESKDPRSKGMYYHYAYVDLGFQLKEKWIKSEKNGKYSNTIIRDEDGYFVVGNIYNFNVAEKINNGDKIVSLDGKEFKNVEYEKYIDFLLDKKKGENISVLLKDNDGKEYSVNLKRELNTYTLADYDIDYLRINNIDIKNNSYSISTINEFSYLWRFHSNVKDDQDHILYKLALGTLIFEEFENEYHYYMCNPDDDDFIFSQLLDPSTYEVKNLIKSDKSLERIKNEITPYSKLKGIENTENAINVAREKSNVFEINNEFNLRSFPFDKQTLVFEVVDNEWNADQRLLRITSKTFKILDSFMKKDDIPGWEKNNYELSYITENQIGMMEGEYAQGIKLTLELERKFGYYIFKVIFPIILILLICWSSVWINPKELESRLTITIVCLLSLIAYNFVIDSELPKLEYLTVLDWIILISYIYATLPNILSVYSFRISSTNQALCQKVEGIAREFGIISYIGLVILIIALNANLHPENSGSLISWMAVTN